MGKNLKGQSVDPDFVVMEICPSLTRRLGLVLCPLASSYDTCEAFLFSLAPNQSFQVVVKPERLRRETSPLPYCRRLTQESSERRGLLCNVAAMVLDAGLEACLSPHKNRLQESQRARFNGGRRDGDRKQLSKAPNGVVARVHGRNRCQNDEIYWQGRYKVSDNRRQALWQRDGLRVKGVWFRCLGRLEVVM